MQAVVKKNLEKLKIMIKDRSSHDKDLILKAFYFADEKHKGQKRKTGEDYIIHPLMVTLTLVEWQTSTNVICAGLLHDTIEDTQTTFDEVVREFNPKIADIVDAVTKVSIYGHSNRGQVKAETLKKIYLSLSHGIEAITVKLADRLHNMRTLSFHKNRQKIEEVANETLEVYAPISARLGMYELKRELEDISFMYLNKSRYDEIQRRVDAKISKNKNILENLKHKIMTLLDNNGIKKVEISSRIKNIYSIYSKMYHSAINFEQIEDLFAIRVVVNNVSECYEVLGLIHQNFNIKNKGIIDYISMPKHNLYQSLHTKIIDKNEICEVQIRTKKMDEIAKNGMASHWIYKEIRGVKDKESTVKFFNSFLDFKEQDKDEQAKDIIELAKKDIFTKNIKVYSSNTEKFADVPAGSTILDLAFILFKEKAFFVNECSINGIVVNLNHPLTNDDLCKIDLGDKNNCAISWMNLVSSKQAKHLIENYLRNNENIAANDFDKTIVMIQKELNNNLAKPEYKNKITTSKKALKRMNSIGIMSYLDLYTRIASGQLTVEESIKFFYLKNMIYSRQEIVKAIKSKTINSEEIYKFINVLNYTNIYEMFLSKCCYPLPGDQILGIETNKKIHIHRISCNHLIEIRSKHLIECEWKNEVLDSNDDLFLSKIEIKATNEPQILYKLFEILRNQLVKIITAKIYNEQGSTTVKLELKMKNANVYNVIRHSVTKINGVVFIKR